MSTPSSRLPSPCSRCRSTPTPEAAARAADLRHWLTAVEGFGELRRIDGAHWDREIGGLSELTYRRRGPALLFDHVPHHPPGFRVLTSSTNSARRLGFTLGLGSEHTDASLVAALRGLPNHWARQAAAFPHHVVSQGPVTEVTATGDDVDLLRFPAPLWHAGDGGRYVGTGCAVATVDPDTGWVNLGAYRSMLVDARRVTLNIEQGKHGRLHLEKWFAREGRAPIALHLGIDPLFLVLAGIEVPTGVSELDYAGAILGAPIPVLRSDLTGLPLIASAEIVLEGWLEPGNRTDEGPFGEWVGYYARGRQQEPWLRIDRVLHRRDPILLGAPPGKPPHDYSYMRTIMKSALIFDALVEAGIPDIRAVYAPECGGGRLLTVVAIKQRYAGHARQAAMVAAQCRAAAYMNRFTIVVDEDIDVTNLEEVLWAVCTRTDPVTSIDIIRRGWASKVDPLLRTGDALVNSRAVIDACRPFEWIDDFPAVAEADPAYLRELADRWGGLFV